MEFGFPITMASQSKRPSYCGQWRPPQFQLLQIRGATAILELHSIPSPSTRPGHGFPRESQCFSSQSGGPKNDPLGKGTQVVLGSTHSRPLCPVNALKKFLEARPPSPEPLFITEDASPFTERGAVSKYAEPSRLLV